MSILGEWDGWIYTLSSAILVSSCTESRQHLFVCAKMKINYRQVCWSHSARFNVVPLCSFFAFSARLLCCTHLGPFSAVIYMGIWQISLKQINIVGGQDNCCKMRSCTVPLVCPYTIIANSVQTSLSQVLVSIPFSSNGGNFAIVLILIVPCNTLHNK